MAHDVEAATPVHLRPDAGSRPAPPPPWPMLIIFDCDGVLIDSEIVVCRLTSEELTRLGFPISTEEVIRRFAGRPEREMLAEIGGDWGRSVPAEYSTRMKMRVEQSYATELRIMPGIVDLLERLQVDVCVASSAYPAKLKLGLDAVGLYEAFAPHIVSASYVARGKPAPDVFIYAAGSMRTPVANCLVIEDSVPGVRAAIAAGMRVYGFTGGQHCDPAHGERLLAAGAETVLQSFAGLEDLLPAAF
jgi:HAD superfamily hydrolase (TIGR01509 family)